MRQLALGGIGDDPQGREGNFAVGRRPRGDMQLHVDGMGARSDMQRALGGAVDDGRVDAGKIDDRRAERRRKRPRPGGIAPEWVRHPRR